MLIAPSGQMLRCHVQPGARVGELVGDPPDLTAELLHQTPQAQGGHDEHQQTQDAADDPDSDQHPGRLAHYRPTVRTAGTRRASNAPATSLVASRRTRCPQSGQVNV